MTWTTAEIALPHLKVETQEQVIRTVGGGMHRAGYVKASYMDAVLAREKIFPTGLPTPEIQVAIPHTDPEHVIRPSIAVTTLVNPVSFIEMGTEDSILQVSLVCLLAVTEAEFLVSLLRDLVNLFQDTPYLKRLFKASTPEALAKLMNDRLPPYQET